MIAWVMAVIGLCVAVTIILLIRRDHLHAKHGLGWILVAVVFAGAGLFPWLLDAVALRVGIAYPPALALTIGIAILVVKVLTMDIERSRLETRYQRLVQRVAMLETDLLREQRNKVKTPSQ